MYQPDTTAHVSVTYWACWGVRLCLELQQDPGPTPAAPECSVGGTDGNNPNGMHCLQWVMVTAVVTVFIQGLSGSTAAAIELLGDAFGETVVSDRFSTCNHLPIQQRQLCWAHLIRDLTAIVERSGASAEFGAELLGQQQLFGH